MTVATLLDEYAAIAEWELSTREANEGYIRRTIKPALGHLQVRKVRGPILDKLYARLKRCSDPSCTGRPFTEHRRIPVLIGPCGLPAGLGASRGKHRLHWNYPASRSTTRSTPEAESRPCAGRTHLHRAPRSVPTLEARLCLCVTTCLQARRTGTYDGR